MKTNFKIISFTEIEFNSLELDLHNNFDFISADTEITNKRIVLHFRKSKGDWAKNTKYCSLYFILNNYTFLKQIDPKTEFLEDDTCLSGITFFDSDFREEDYSLVERTSPNSNDDIIFSFESERIIRANCETVTIETN